MICAVSLGVTAQVTYPYNPDGNADTLIGVTDLQDLLVTYGQPFLPSEILVADSSLSFWVEQVSEVLASQQAIIDSLTSVPDEMVLCQSENFHLLSRDTLYYSDFQCDFDCWGGETAIGGVSKLASAYELDGNCNTILGWASLPEEVLDPSDWQQVFVVLPDSMPYDLVHLFGDGLPQDRYLNEIALTNYWPSSNCCDINNLEVILTSFDSSRPTLVFGNNSVSQPVFDGLETLSSGTFRQFQGFWFGE